jgi:hypothetical protein
MRLDSDWLFFNVEGLSSDPRLETAMSMLIATAMAARATGKTGRSCHCHPIDLHCGQSCSPLIDEEDVGELSALDIAKQRISIGESCEGLIEGQRSSRPWLILKGVAHGGAQIDTELKRMPAPRERKIVNPLGLLRNLGLRQEIRRADESKVGKGDL